MTRSIQLLKQVRAVTRHIETTSTNAEHQAMLSVADILLNELMLQEDRQFYLDVIAQGRELLDAGQALARDVSGAVLPARNAVEVTESLCMEVLDAKIEALFKDLVGVVNCLDERRSVGEKEWLSQVTQWESRLYQHSLQQCWQEGAEDKGEITRENLLSYLQHKFPHWAGLTITRFEILAGGISKKTILFETEDKVNGRQSMVIRAEQPVNLLHYDGSQVSLEYYAICLMQREGMPVAEPLWLEQDEHWLGVRFIVSRKAEGSVIGGNFGSYQPLTRGQVASFMSNLFKMHSIRPDFDDPLVQQSHLRVWMPYKTVNEATTFYVNEFLPLLISRAGIKPTPEMMRALRWLQANVPDCDEPAVVIHLDYAFNNMIFDGDNMTALLDWETSRLADPAEDFTWTQPNLGVYTMAEFREKYREGTGRDVSEYRIAYAAVSKCLTNLIAGRTGLAFINNSDSAPLHMGVMAYKFMPMLGANVDELIAAAEAFKPDPV
jgi:aminoglycoside phosphotransferase (APT) family kinase protein